MLREYDDRRAGGPGSGRDTLFTAPSATAAADTTAAPAAALPCHASMSNTKPKDHTTTYVIVNTVKDAPAISVTAAFKTNNVSHSGTSDSKGVARIGIAVGNATPGYRVKVDVSVFKGTGTGYCSTSFTPQK